MRSHGILALLGMVVVPTALIAQTSSTSALAGVVRDSRGKLLAGAVVRISSPSMIGGEKITVTALGGAYRFPELPPGRYKIVVEAEGFSALIQPEVLELGKTSTVNWQFPAAGATVEVVAADVDATPAGLTQNFDTITLASIPMDRSLSGIMALAPGINGGVAWGGDINENAWMMDGINIGDPSGNSQRMRVNPDWFSEVQIGGVGASAEFGGFNGAYVNALVKRGGNELEGSFNTYFASSRWESQSSNSDPRIEDRTLSPAKSYDAGLNLGGPILKDRLWYFASIWSHSDETTPIGTSVSDKRSNLNFLGKVTWQATPTATLEFLVEYDSTPEEHQGIDLNVQPIASRKQVATNHLGSATWTQTLGPSAVLTLKASGYSGNSERRPYNGDQPGLDTEDTDDGFEYYNNHQWYQNDYRNRLEGTVTLDVFKTGLLTPNDSHAFRIGFEQAQASDEETKVPTGGVNLFAYEDEESENLVTDVFDVGGGWRVRERTNRTALFLQDTWTVNDWLILRPGIRFERFRANPYSEKTIWDKKTLAFRFGGTIALTQDQANLLKFHYGRYYAAFSTHFIDRSTQEMVPVQTEYRWGAPADGYQHTVINPSDPSTWPATAINDPGNPPSAVINNYTPVDPSAKQPYTNELTFAFEHTFKGPWSCSVTWVFREQKDILARVASHEIPNGSNATGTWINGTFTDYRVDSTGNTQTPYTYYATNLASSQEGFLVTTAPQAKRNYVAATFVLNRKWQDGWSFTGSLTRARRYGNTDSSDSYDPTAPFENPNNRINAYGLLEDYHDYECKIRAVEKLPWDLRISESFTYLSGQRWTPYVRTPLINGVRYNVYVEPLGTEKFHSEHLLDIRLSKFIELSPKSRIEVFGEVFNALNTGTATDWSERVNSVSYMVPETVEQGRRLQVGVRVNF